MFTTTAVVLAIALGRCVEGRNQDVNLLAFSGAVLITLGVIADRITSTWPPTERCALV
jgi:hypothetical protein